MPDLHCRATEGDQAAAMSMSERIEAIVAQAKALSAEEREVLIAALQMTLDPPEPGWERAWLEECRDRIAAIERGEMKLIDGDEVMAQARARLRTL